MAAVETACSKAEDVIQDDGSAQKGDARLFSSGYMPAGIVPGAFSAEEVESAAAGKEEVMAYDREKTAIQAVKQARDWGTYYLIAEATRDTRVRILEKVFLVAVDQEDDEAACRYFGWLMQAISDWEFWPLLEKQGGGLGMGPGQSLTAEELAVDAAALERRVEKARELYWQLPLQKRRFAGQGQFMHWVETRRAIFTEIARSWRETKNEAMADSLIGFITEAARTSLDDEREAMLRVICQVTDMRFPRARLLQGIRRLVPQSGETPSGSDSEMVKILANAWVRWASVMEIAYRLTPK